MKDRTMYNLYLVAFALNIPNEHIEITSNRDGVFSVKTKAGAKYDALCNKIGKVKIKTIRPA